MTDGLETTKILIVEGEALVAMDLEVRLKQLGYTICGRSSTVEKALELVEQHLPDLVMMDIMLQGEIDGIEAAELIRDNWGIPVVFLTAYADTTRLERAKLASPFGYLLKPFQDRDLKITVEMALYVAKVEAERRKAESALKEREALLNATGTMAKVGGWELDADTLQVSWTEQTYRIHEVPLDYKPPLEEALNFYHPDDRRKLSDAINLALEQGEPYDMEIRFITAKGNQLWTRTKCIPELIDGKVVKLKGTFQDITARKEAEYRLRLSEKWNREIVQKVSTAIVVHDADTRIIVSNKKAQELLGLNEDQLLGKEAIDPEWKFVNSDGEKMALEDYPVIKVLTENRPLPNLTVGIYRLSKNDLIWVIINAEPLRDSIGNIQKIILSFTDITEQRQAEEALRESERRYRQLYNHAPAGIYDIDFVNNRITSVNDVACHVTGYSREEILSMNPLEFLGGASRDDFIKRLESHSLGKTVSDSIEYEIITKSGASIWVLLSISFKHDKNQIAGASVVAHDITDKVRAEKALSKSEEKYRNILENIEDGYYEVDIAGNFTFFNKSMCQILGYSADELMGMNNREYMDVENAKKIFEVFHNVYQTGMATKALDWKLIRKDGSECYVETVVSLVTDSNNNKVGFRGIARDVSERKQAEEELRESKMFLDNLTDIAYMADDQGNLVWANSAAEVLTGFSLEKIIGKPFLPLFIDDDHASLMSVYKRTLMGESLENTLTFTSGVSCHFTSLPRRNDQGKIIGTFGIARDISESLKAERALQVSEARLKKAQETAKIGNWEYDISTGKVWGSEEAFRVYGIERTSEFLPLDEVESFIREAKRVNQALVDLITEKKAYDIEFEINPKNRDGLALIHSIAELVSDDSGNPVKVLGVIQDITEQRRVENEKAKLQSQLQQAQKMEAIGTLVGGVAHDFNNLLQAINGYTQLLLMEKSEKDSEYTSLMAIQNSGMRASELVRSLLLFSRKAETERKPLELNIEVEHVRRILERTIPKMVDISFYPGSRLWPVMADPVQIEQILLNLGTNAADAMPDGGKLILETENITIDAEYAKKPLNAQPGRYVLLTISDTGHGMDRETQAKIFDPFFTTKEIGKGTGLGLASVYGIVQSHGGYIRCYSEVGIGTTFKIYFPAIAQPEIQETEDVKSKPVPKGTETILLVDDEEAIRGFAQQALLKFGYKAMTASTGEEALEVYRSHSGTIDLVITDIGMPGMGGHRCVEELLKINPEAKIIIASGYPINGQVRRSMDTGAAGYIGKPYQLSDLLNTVRAVLDSEAA